MADTVETRCTIRSAGFLDNGVTIARNDAPVTSIPGRAVDRLYQRKPFTSHADRVALLFVRYQALTEEECWSRYAIVGDVPGRARPDCRHIPVGAANVVPHLQTVRDAVLATPATPGISGDIDCACVVG